MDDWIRAAKVLGIASSTIALSIALAPWMLVPFAILGLFGGGMVIDRPDDDRPSRKRVAHRSGVLALIAVAVVWSLLTEHQGPIRLALALTLGAGAGVAALGLVLIGMDARMSTRSARPDQG